MLLIQFYSEQYRCRIHHVINKISKTKHSAYLSYVFGAICTFHFLELEIEIVKPHLGETSIYMIQPWSLLCGAGGWSSCGSLTNTNSSITIRWNVAWVGSKNYRFKGSDRLLQKKRKHGFLLLNNSFITHKNGLGMTGKKKAIKKKQRWKLSISLRGPW